MRRLAIIVLFSLMLAACSSNDPKELYETAQFEELQHNTGHAIELYSEIIKKHPQSEYAQKAKERLSELSKGAK